MKKVFNIALSQYGVTEIVGSTKHNPHIVRYFDDIGQHWVKNDETAWCAAFANWCLKKEGFEFTGKLNARSFLDIGWEVKEPQIGDVVVLWRESPNSWKGHVGFFVRQDSMHVYMLGGNQGNQVNITAYRKDRVLSVRRLKEL